MLPTPSILTSFRWGQERRSQPGGLGKGARSNTVWRATRRGDGSSRRRHADRDQYVPWGGIG